MLNRGVAVMDAQGNVDVPSANKEKSPVKSWEILSNDCPKALTKANERLDTKDYKKYAFRQLLTQGGDRVHQPPRRIGLRYII